MKMFTLQLNSVQMVVKYWVFMMCVLANLPSKGQDVNQKHRELINDSTLKTARSYSGLVKKIMQIPNPIIAPHFGELIKRDTSAKAKIVIRDPSPVTKAGYPLVIIDGKRFKN